MRKWIYICLFLFFPWNIQAAEQKLEELLIPPLTVTLEPILGLTPENQKELIDNPERQHQEDIRNLQLIAEKRIPFLWIALATLAIGFFIFAKKHYPIWLEVMQRQLRKPVDPRKESLLALEKISHAYSQNPDKFYIALSDIVKDYLWKYFHFPIKEKTTEEFIQKIESRSLLPSSSQKALTELLKKADLVKFALVHPTDEECAEAVHFLKEFINISDDSMM